MKKQLITKAVFCNSLGNFNPVTGKIMYDTRLDNYPALKKFILKHELSHRKDYPSIFKIFKREVVDYFKIRFSKKTRKEFAKFVNNDDEGLFMFMTKLSADKVLLLVFMNILLSLYVVVLNIIALPYMLYLVLKKRKILGMT